MTYSSLGANTAIARLAADAGIFDRYGLEMDMMYIAGGGTSIQALVGGSVDVVYGGGTAMLGAIANGAAIKAIACPTPTVVLWLFSRPEIRSAQDMRGKTLGVTQRATLGDYAVSVWLKRFGMRLDTDVPVIAVHGQPEILAGLSAGAIDAGVLVPPRHEAARKMGLYELADFTAENIPAVSSCLVVKTDWLAANRPVAERLVKALVEGVALAARDKEAALKAIGVHTQTEDRAELESAYQAYIVPMLKHKAPYVPVEGVKFTIEDTAQYNPAIANLKPEDAYDNSIVAELERSGFIDRAFR